MGHLGKVVLGEAMKDFYKNFGCFFFYSARPIRNDIVWNTITKPTGVSSLMRGGSVCDFLIS